MKKLCLVALSSLTMALSANSQSFYAIRRERNLILSGGIGTSTYFGELSQPHDYVQAKPNVNLALQYYITDRIALRGDLNWYVLQGNDANAADKNRRVRNLSFKSNNFEFDALAQINLIPNGNRYYRRATVNAYLIGGIGMTYFNPKATYKGTAYPLEPLHTEGVGYSRVTPVIPFGLGVRFMLTPTLNLGFEAMYRKTFTDRLDDVSGKYLNNASFTDPIAKALADRRGELTPPQELWPAGHIRGNPKTKDGYMLMTVRLEYYLPWDVSGSRRGNGLQKRKRSNYLYRRNGTLRRR